ncbi:MAG: glycosyltransferase [Bacteroidales bacterium]|jgi:glycosyltransferase involved in cell wall biosynthesis|nr:glycosyltransferase [Bacteroidales bacterium]
MNDLVSIITPCYNDEKYIGQAIESVLSQSYQNWEMFVVDDGSTDRSAELIRSYCEKDKRISYYKTDVPSGGATIPRNIAIEKANGRFIAFLDSDDVWLPTKLEQQIELFSDETTAIVFSNHEKINEIGERKNRIVIAPKTASYKELLKENTIRTSAGIYDTKKVGKVYFQEIGHEDFVFWLSILKQGYLAKNTNTVTVLYRERKKSLSANKILASKWTWTIYRNVEKLSIVAALYYFLNYCVRAGLKYLK